MKNDMEFVALLGECGVTEPRLDLLIEKLDDQDGGDFLNTNTGRFIKTLVMNMERIFDRNIADGQAFYLVQDSAQLLGAVTVLYEDDEDDGSRISDEFIEEVEEVVRQINSAYDMLKAQWIKKGELL